MSKFYKNISNLENDKITQLRLFWLGVPLDAPRDNNRFIVSKVIFEKALKLFGDEWTTKHLL